MIDRAPLAALPRNEYGDRAETTSPVIVEKPDMRTYPKKRKKIDTASLSGAERKRFAIAQKYNRPPHTRWRTGSGNGVCDRFGDYVTIYTGECQRDGCKKWFSVERYPATLKARWPLYCSQSCRDIAAGTKKRKNSKRLRNGETSGEKRPEVQRFDPDTVELPYWAAADIVERNVTSTPTAYGQASEYLDEVEAEQPRDSGFPNVGSAEYYQGINPR